MNLCPHCGAALALPHGRFCDGCGLSLGAATGRRRRRTAAASPSAAARRCPDCGLVAESDRPTCRGCGTRVPTQEEP